MSSSSEDSIVVTAQLVEVVYSCEKARVTNLNSSQNSAVLISPPTSPISRRVPRSPTARSNSTSSLNSNKTPSNRHLRKQQQQQQQQMAKKQAHNGSSFKPIYLIIPGVLGALYLIAIFALACWECFVAPERVRRLNEGALAVEYHKNTERVPRPTKTSSSSNDHWDDEVEFRMKQDDEPAEQSRTTRHRINLDDPNIANIDPSAEIEQDEEIPEELPEELSRPRFEFVTPGDSMPQFLYDTSARKTSYHRVRHAVLSDGTNMFQCSDWAAHSSKARKASSDTRGAATSRDIVFLSARTFFGAPPYSFDNMDQAGTHAFAEICQFAKTSGVVDSVTVLDLADESSPSAVLRSLNEMSILQLIAMLPVAALVTPGASTNIIVDWMLHGTPEELHSLRFWVARHWITVDAQIDLAKIPDAQTELSVDGLGTIKSHQPPLTYSARGVNPFYAFAKEYGRLPIFSIYGTNDALGQASAFMLNDNARATVGQVHKTGENCLLNAPADVSGAIVTYLQNEDDFHRHGREKSTED